ncbi:MAG TPA: glycosyltransferase family 39 protein [Thermoanaerobaculia bacterium]
MRPRYAFGLFAAFSLARALLVPAFELMPQSAYYFTYAEHPALSYYDHPPMIGWLLWAGAVLFGKSALAVRGTVFVTTLATQLAVYALGRRLLGEEAAGRALVFLTASGVALLLSFIAVPDVPLLLFWALSLLALERALFGGEGSSKNWLPWLLTGTAMGLAFLSKYTGVFLQGGLVLFLLASPGHRRLLRTPKPWLALAVAQVVSLPVWIWNLRHDFASFAFQLGGRAAESRFDPDDALGFLASQAAVLLPVGFGLFVWVVGKRTVQAVRKRGAIDPQELFLLAFALPLFATCIALSTLTWVKVNWPMPAYLSGLLLVAPAVGRRATAWQAGLGGALLLAAAVQLVYYPVRVGSNDTWWGWRELAAEAEALHESHPDRFLFSGDNYKTTAELRFYTDLPVYGMNVIGWNALQYDYIGEDLSELVGRDAFLIQEEEKLRPSERTERYLLRTRLYFESVEEVEPIELRHRGDVTRLFRVFDCRNYRGPHLPIPRELYSPER